ncbi:MAG: hypothetical protein IJV46_09670 [Acidaminococcaceae bacterium]|nr:hypothetical protein [Acidaminococcaceae bacterium]
MKLTSTTKTGYNFIIRNRSEYKNQDNEKSYLLRLPVDIMKNAKIVAAHKDVTLKEFFQEAIVKACQEFKNQQF